MARIRLFLIGGIALVIACLLTFIAYRGSMGQVRAIKAKNTRVILAASDLELGHKLEAGDLRLAELPASEIPQGVFRDLSEVVGRSVVQKVAKNEVLLASKVTGDKSSSGLTALIPANMRAVSVKVNEVVAVAGFVQPGSRVDVLVTGAPDSNGQTTVTTTVLENVEVLAAGQKLQPSESEKPETVAVITLMVSPEDAQKLTLAASEGRIQLSLRNPTDSNAAKPKPTGKNVIYQSAGNGQVMQNRPVPVSPLRAAAKSAPVAPVAPSVEVYRGLKRDVAKF